MERLIISNFPKRTFSMGRTSSFQEDDRWDGPDDEYPCDDDEDLEGCVDEREPDYLRREEYECERAVYLRQCAQDERACQQTTH